MPKPPHIVIFNPDQWRGDVLGHAGNPAAVTPNLDRLVESEAVSFTSAFCQNPVCTPSRCSFMTGWYPHVRGHRTMFHMLRHHQGEPNLLRRLRDNGYFVWWGGKNDLVPGQLGYAQDCDVKLDGSEASPERWGHSQPTTSQDWRGTPESDTYYGFYAGRLDKGDDEIFCDRDWVGILEAVDFIRDYDADKPLCIYLPLGYPHPPYRVEEPWFSAIDREKLPARVRAPADWAGKPSILKGIWERQRMQTWTEDRWTELRAAYYGMCARLDHQFSLVLDALREAGLYDDSAVFLFSDHGDFTGDYGLVEKAQNSFEDCLTRVPFILKTPKGHPVRPRVCDALVELVDFSATVFDLTGMEPGYDSFGRSLLPLVAGESDTHRDAVFCEGGRRFGERQAMELEAAAHQVPEGIYWPRLSLQRCEDAPYHTKAAMCRTRGHKYVRRLYEQDELYDLETDSHEIHNLIEDPAYRDTLLALRERMLTWYMETCDVVPHDTDERS